MSKNLGSRLAGGTASRAELYGLFIAAIVLVGGGVGGAYAVTFANQPSSESQQVTDPEMGDQRDAGSQTDRDSGVGTDAPSPDGHPATLPTPATPATPANPGGPGAPANPATPASPPDPASPAPASPPSSSPPDVGVPTLIETPYIGPADTFSYLSRGHICGWDFQALGGFGWGFDPAEPCNGQFLDYIATHCEADDGVVFAQRCDEYFAGRLPIAYP